MSFSNFFRNHQHYYTTRKDELFNSISLEPDQKEVIFKRVAEAKSPLDFERKLIAFLERYPSTRSVAIIGNSIIQSKETFYILDDKLKQLAHQPTIEFIDLMELSAMDHYYSVAYNSNYLKILMQNRKKDLKHHLSKQKKSTDLIYLNIIPILGKDYCKELFDHIKKQNFQLIIMNESCFRDMKHFLVKDTKSLPKHRNIYKAVFVI